jgi:hypothetical protein
MAMLGYIQSVVMVLWATGATAIWTGLILANPNIGPQLRSLVYTDVPIETRAAQVMEAFERAVSGPVLAGVALATVIWLCAWGWLLVAIGAFRHMWRVSRLRAFGILILTAGMLSLAGAFVVFAATL